MSTPLSLERFAALLEAYGARPELWPATERDAALALRDASSEARALFDAEVAFDLELSAVPGPELGGDFLRRLNEVPLRAPQKRALFSARGWWVPALSWAFAGVLGLGFGLSTELPDEEDLATSVVAVDSAAPTATATTTMPDDDFSALARGSLTELEE